MLHFLCKIRTTCTKDFVPMLCVYGSLWKDTQETQYLEDREEQEISTLYPNALYTVCPLQIQCKNATC